MGKIFCLIGKSVSGKDTIYRELFSDENFELKKVIPYTTRPIRDGEIEGREYHFVDDATAAAMEQAGKVIEKRTYHTVYGPWHYFTADDGQIVLSQDSYLVTGTLEMYLALRSYFGEEAVLPIYVEVEDGERLLRAIARERSQKQPKYEEMCRRFLADASDFSEEKLKEAGIERRFENIEFAKTLESIRSYIEASI